MAQVSMAAEPALDENGTDEELEDVPEDEKLADNYWKARVLKSGYYGTVEEIERGTVTKDRLYRVRYDDGDLEHFTVEMMKDHIDPSMKEEASTSKEVQKKPAAGKSEPADIPQEDAEGDVDMDAEDDAEMPELPSAVDSSALSKKPAAAQKGLVDERIDEPDAEPDAAEEDADDAENAVEEDEEEDQVPTTKRPAAAMTAAVLKRPAAAIPQEEDAEEAEEAEAAEDDAQDADAEDAADEGEEEEDADEDEEEEEEDEDEDEEEEEVEAKPVLKKPAAVAAAAKQAPAAKGRALVNASPKKAPRVQKDIAKTSVLKRPAGAR